MYRTLKSRRKAKNWWNFSNPNKTKKNIQKTNTLMNWPQSIASLWQIHNPHSNNPQSPTAKGTLHLSTSIADSPTKNKNTT